jgi:glycosyltransferase involved in cell wall biosynthesis
MNISLCTYPWAFDTPGGGERQLQNYYDALQRGQHKWPTLKVKKFDPWKPDFSEINIMHYFGCMPSSVEFLKHVKAIRGIPIILSPNFWPDPDGWKKSNVYEEIKTILWLSNLMVVNSFTEEEALVRLMQIDSSRISVVPNAADSIFFTKVSQDIFRQKYNISGKFILNIANIEQRKNQLAFLKALKAFPDLTLVTIGHVREDWYADACVLEGAEQFRLIPPQEPGSVMLRSAMAGCEFFAMPSLVETPSIASLEAGAAGVKVLTTHLGSTKDYFKDTVTYINPFDVESMKKGIGIVSKNLYKNNLPDLISENFTWDIIVEKLVGDAYSRVAGHQLNVINAL